MLIDREHLEDPLPPTTRELAAGPCGGQLGVQVDAVRDADLLRELGLDPDSRAQGGGLGLR